MNVRTFFLIAYALSVSDILDMPHKQWILADFFIIESLNTEAFSQTLGIGKFLFLFSTVFF